MTAIDVEKLRAEHPTMRSKDAWELLPALLDEVERLRKECDDANQIALASNAAALRAQHDATAGDRRWQREIDRVNNEKRDILNVLAIADGALQHAVDNDPRNGVLTRALAAIQALGISKQRT